MLNTLARLFVYPPRMTTNQVRLRIAPDDWDTLGELGGGILSRQSVAAALLSAACDAVRQNGGRLNFPPHLTVGIHNPRAVQLNDEPARRRK